MKNSLTKKIVVASMLASLICVATMIIKIPTPFKGYINFGDGIVIIAGWFLSPLYGFLASGIGAGLADVFSGYATYLPATFFIKGIMALIMYYGRRFLCNKVEDKVSRIISGTVAEIFMVFGYFVFEALLYGFGASVVNIFANAVQGIFGVVIGAVLINLFEKHKIFYL